jgi:hypothetical protein
MICILTLQKQALAPDMDDFRLGVQKCRKTIEDGVGNSGIFRVEGVDSLFRMLRMAAGPVLFNAIICCNLINHGTLAN